MHKYGHEKIVSQPVSVARDGELLVVELGSFVRGYPYCARMVSHYIRQVRSIKREPDNPYNSHAVTVYCKSCTIGHVPYNLAPTYSAFLRREVNKGVAVAVGLCLSVCRLLTTIPMLQTTKRLMSFQHLHCFKQRS